MHVDTLRNLTESDLQRLGELLVTAWTLSTAMGHTSPGLTLETYCAVEAADPIAQLGRDMIVGCLPGHEEEVERIKAAVHGTTFLDVIAHRAATA